MAKRKTDNDSIFFPPVIPNQPRQLGFFKFIYKEEPVDDRLAQWREQQRVKLAVVDNIYSELFPEYQWLYRQSIPGAFSCNEIPLEVYEAVWDEYYRRHPKQVPPSPVHEPMPLPPGEYKTFSIRWGNPYTTPPNGLPDVLWRFTTRLSHPTPKQQAKLDAIYARNPRGYSYAIGFGSDKTDSGERKWSEERKQKNRLRLLEKRLAKKYTIPSLYESALVEAVLSKPDEYYGLKHQALKEGCSALLAGGYDSEEHASKDTPNDF